MFLTLNDVSFTYEGAHDPVFDGLRLTVGRGWTGVVGANGSGKSTLLRIALGELAPTSGQVVAPGPGHYCPQRTDATPAGFGALLRAADSRAQRLKDQMGIALDWEQRWQTLSHGERKRAQIAVLLHGEPALVAVDEPTNHLDREARDLVWRALGSFGGIGLLVSHDRDLLDDLCSRCIFLDPPGVALRRGSYTEGARQAAQERTALLRQRARVQQEVRQLRRELGVRREQDARSERQRSKRGLARGDHDARARIDAARVADSGSGQRSRQLEGRLQHAVKREAGLVLQREHTMGVALGGGCSPRGRLLSLPEREISLGPGRVLWTPALAIHSEDRIGIQGPNGAGKSTLVRVIVAGLERARERVAYIPQEIDAAGSQEILREFLGLPSDRLGSAMALVRRLGSDPARLLQSREPSPGELRKLLLATCIDSEPHVVILDEPTNHLDLPSIECLENALESCAMALVMVSHDQRFLDRLARRRWHIRPCREGRWELAG
jgi:macrolide transport system ATP-binding/permease protein